MFITCCDTHFLEVSAHVIFWWLLVVQDEKVIKKNRVASVPPDDIIWNYKRLSKYRSYNLLKTFLAVDGGW